MYTLTESPTKTGQLPEEFEQLFSDHCHFVYRTAYRVMRSAEDAENILQAMFLRLLRRPAGKGIGDNPRAYPYRAACEGVQRDDTATPEQELLLDCLDARAPETHPHRPSTD